VRRYGFQVRISLRHQSLHYCSVKCHTRNKYVVQGLFVPGGGISATLLRGCGAT
jgi:hypothetical protein